MKRIAMDLNADRVASPQARPGRSQSWAQSSVRHVLLNERYRGVVIWGKTKKVRAPETGKRIYRRRPESEWRRVEVPEQRIVSEKLWTRTLERIHMVRDLYGVADGKRRGRAAASPYLFTGLLECSECGGSITIVSGRSPKSRGFAIRMLSARATGQRCLHERIAGLTRGTRTSTPRWIAGKSHPSRRRRLHAEAIRRRDRQSPDNAIEGHGRSSKRGKRTRSRHGKPTSRRG
jgi:hypothetical protein